MKRREEGGKVKGEKRRTKDLRKRARSVIEMREMRERDRDGRGERGE